MEYSMNKRVIILTAFYEEQVGYQEVQLTKILQRLHYEVLVVATDRANYDRTVRYEDPESSGILRIKKHIRIKNTFLPLENIKERIERFHPDIALVIHPNAGLPYFYLKYLPASCKVISFFGDLLDKNKIGKADNKGNKFIQKYIKDNWYNKTFQRSDIIVANTNETSETLKNTATTAIDEKIVMPGLGFDPIQYYLSPEHRIQTRRELNIPLDHIVFVTITRVYPGKPVVEWLTPIIEQMRKNPRLTYIFAGFMDTELSRSIKRELEKFNLGHQLRLLDFTSAEYNNKLFNAADYSLWYTPTISIQQSMATGLPAIIPHDATVDHLVEPGINGMFYSNFGELSEIVSTIKVWNHERLALAEYNKKFSYDSIINFLFSRIQ